MLGVKRPKKCEYQHDDGAGNGADVKRAAVTRSRKLFQGLVAVYLRVWGPSATSTAALGLTIQAAFLHPADLFSSYLRLLDASTAIFPGLPDI